MRVPRANLLGEEGTGFALAQARLGPGRIHHCMRSIGQCELALDLMVKRSKERKTFGKYLHEHGVVPEWIALSRCEIEQARLLVLKAAWMIDSRRQGRGDGNLDDQGHCAAHAGDDHGPRDADVRRDGPVA